MDNDYIVYVKTNADGYITAVNSSAFLSDTTEWTEIDRGYGDKYHHAQGNYFPMPLYTDGGAFRYRLHDGKPVECSADDIAAQELALLPELPTEEDSEKVSWDELAAAIREGVNEA